MKKIVLLTVFFCISILLNAQENNEKNVASFELGSGLNFSFNEGNYQFNFGGFIKPAYTYSKIKGMDAENQVKLKGGKLIVSCKDVSCKP